MRSPIHSNECVFLVAFGIILEATGIAPAQGRWDPRSEVVKTKQTDEWAPLVSAFYRALDLAPVQI